MGIGVGDALLSAFLQVLIDRIASQQFVDLIRGKKFTENALRKLKTTLNAVSVVINEADQKQIKYPEVKEWLDELKDVLYHADDLFDRISTKAAAQKEVGNLLSRFPPYILYGDRKRTEKIEGITRRIESILKNKKHLGLEGNVVREKSWTLQSTSLVEFDVYGRDHDKKAIINMLLSDGRNDDRVSVIPIVGLGGIGKTTLARLVYNDDRVKEKFDFRAWVCVSREFDVTKITKTIIDDDNSHFCDATLDKLQKNLKEKLAGKKFLIVLDDIWNVNYESWDVLRRPLENGIKGSKILVTTCNVDVASVLRTDVQPYPLKPLSDEDCWHLFAKHAFLSGEFIVSLNAGELHAKIVEKCKGVPLVAKTLAGILRSIHDISDWSNLLKSDIWDLLQSQTPIILPLKISYHCLPSHLKRCFVYCSIFPKNYEFQKKEIIFLWMAEGFLQPTTSGKTLEDVGEEYFHDLASVCFFQPSNKNGFFVMHDLIHDLATHEAREFYIRYGDKEITSRTRHLFYERNNQNQTSDEEFEGIGKAKYLRTLVMKKLSREGMTEVPPPDLLSKLKCLRALSLHGFNELPDSINKLIHLRYLYLFSTGIKNLPETLCDLYNLQSLILVCRLLTVLPSDIQKLVNLRCLNIRKTAGLKGMPTGIGELRELQVLSDFVIGKDEGASISELRKLQNLRNSLRVRNLQHVTNVEEVSKAKMIDMKSIKKLHLGWSADVVNDSLVERDILDKLQPHINLKSLTIDRYRGTPFPNWLGSCLYQNVTDISLSGCKNCSLLPPLGQLPSLERLEISKFGDLQEIGAMFYNSNELCTSGNPFPSLKYLKFHRMSAWKEWRSVEIMNAAFPQLHELIISDCPLLMGGLPECLPALETLEIRGCQELASTLPRGEAIHKVEVERCMKLVFQELPASVKKLEINDCRNLEFPNQLCHGSLESLMITRSCYSLTSFPISNFPNLELLHISGCRNLASLSVSNNNPLENLQGVTISDCPNFTSFPREGLPAPNMTYLEVRSCGNLKSFPTRMSSLIKLKALDLWDCQGIEFESSPVEEGEGDDSSALPPDLRSIVIDHCVFARCVDWHSLPLTHLKINGNNDNGVQSFPEGYLLPASLTALSLSYFSSLEALDCKGFVHLSSLRKLDIACCSKLNKMIGDMLPASLTLLTIKGCPLFEERCREKNGELWHKISHIRTIQVADEWGVFRDL